MPSMGVSCLKVMVPSIIEVSRFVYETANRIRIGPAVCGITALAQRAACTSMRCKDVTTQNTSGTGGKLRRVLVSEMQRRQHDRGDGRREV